MHTTSVGFPWMLWRGLAPHGFYSVDYFPVLPWSGVILVRIEHRRSAFSRLPAWTIVLDLALSPVVRALAFLGRNSLAIYLIHQR